MGRINEIYNGDYDINTRENNQQNIRVGEHVERLKTSSENVRNPWKEDL